MQKVQVLLQPTEIATQAEYGDSRLTGSTEGKRSSDSSISTCASCCTRARSTHRQRADVVGAEDDVDPRSPLRDDGAVLLGQAAADGDLHARMRVLHRQQVAYMSKENDALDKLSPRHIPPRRRDDAGRRPGRKPHGLEPTTADHASRNFHENPYRMNELFLEAQQQVSNTPMIFSSRRAIAERFGSGSQLAQQARTFFGPNGLYNGIAQFIVARDQEGQRDHLGGANLGEDTLAGPAGDQRNGQLLRLRRLHLPGGGRSSARQQQASRRRCHAQLGLRSDP